MQLVWHQAKSKSSKLKSFNSEQNERGQRNRCPFYVEFAGV